MVRWLAPMFLLGVVLGACAGAGGDKIAGAWKGHPLDDLILDWGPPAAYYVTSDGRQTATFSHSRFIAANQYYCNATFGTGTCRPPFGTHISPPEHLKASIAAIDTALALALDLPRR